MIRCYCLRLIALALAALAATSVMRPVRAANKDEFSGHISFYSFGAQSFTILEKQGRFSTVRPLGQVGGTVTIGGVGLSRNGEVYLRDRYGNSLRLNFTASYNPNTRLFEGTFDIVPGSGTGKYTGASGNGTMYTNYTPNSYYNAIVFDSGLILVP